MKIAIIGYGNVGRFAVEAVLAAPDLDLAGVVSRRVHEQPSGLKDIRFTDDIGELGQVDVALLTVPTRKVGEYAEDLLAKGINTVDSFDVHNELVDLKLKLDPIAKNHKSVAIVAAGWDPGTDSIIRALFEMMAPRGITSTNFGPGMSMGHTVAVKAIDGVEDALAITVPAGCGIHKRLVYVKLAPGSDLVQIEHQIKQDPYFADSQTFVNQVDELDSLKDMGHGVSIERHGASGWTNNQVFTYVMRITNPALTAQNMVAAARASVKQRPGAYTMLEIPLLHFLAGEPEELLRKLM